jgi:hypothetical protein
MRTSNYDLMVQLNEKLLNKALAMVFYKGKFNIEGSHDFIKDIPDGLQGFNRFNYKIRLNSEPFLDFIDKNTAQIRVSSDLILIILTGIEIKLNLDFSIKSTLEFDLNNPNDRKLIYSLKEVKIIRLVLNDKIQLGKKFISRLNQVFESVLNKYFIEETKQFSIPFAVDNIELPKMPDGDANKLPITSVGVEIMNNKTLLAGLSFFSAPTTPTGIAGLTNGHEFFCAISTDALKKTFDFWWQKTTYPKQRSFEGSHPASFDHVLEKITDTTTKILSLGLLQTETDYENMVLDYGGDISVTDKPEFSFENGNKVIINKLKANAEIWFGITADVRKDIYIDTSAFIPDKITPWHDDKLIKTTNKRKELLHSKSTFEITLENAEATVVMNENNNLAINILQADFKVDFNIKGLNFTKSAVSKIIEFLKTKIIEKMPDIIISPALILSKVNVYGYTYSLKNTAINISSDEITVLTDVDINELVSRPVPVPVYIANTKKHVVHKIDCEFISDIDIENRLGYYVLYEALADNYKACKKCIEKCQIA